MLSWTPPNIAQGWADILESAGIAHRLDERLIFKRFPLFAEIGTGVGFMFLGRDTPVDWLI